MTIYNSNYFIFQSKSWKHRLVRCALILMSSYVQPSLLSAVANMLACGELSVYFMAYFTACCQ